MSPVGFGEACGYMSTPNRAANALVGVLVASIAICRVGDRRILLGSPGDGRLEDVFSLACSCILRPAFELRDYHLCMYVSHKVMKLVSTRIYPCILTSSDVHPVRHASPATLLGPAVVVVCQIVQSCMGIGRPAATANKPLCVLCRHRRTRPVAVLEYMTDGERHGEHITVQGSAMQQFQAPEKET